MMSFRVRINCEHLTNDHRLLQMFALLVTITAVDFAPAPTLIDHWKNPAPEHAPTYKDIINRDATDGRMFKKPMRGHEDGCVLGKCMENATALGNDGVLTTPMHIPVHAHRAY